MPRSAIAAASPRDSPPLHEPIGQRLENDRQHHGDDDRNRYRAGVDERDDEDGKNDEDSDPRPADPTRRPGWTPKE
jgi:hypothetical protein